MSYVLYLCLQLFMSYSIEAYVSYFFFLLFYYWYYHLYRNSRLFLVKFSYGSQSEDSVAGAEEVNPLETVDSATTKASSSPLNPYWVTGFADAESSFTIIIEIMSRTSWKVRASFEINLHSRDIAILKRIQYFFGVGTVYSRTDREISVYRVTALPHRKLCFIF
jgi:LAGLIDADG endonuclease